MDPKREFWKGTYYLIVLKVLEEQETHGYQLRKILETLGNPSESTVYDVLKKLERGGYVKGEWVMQGRRPKKRYRITEKGRELLKELEGQASLLCSFLSGRGK